MKQSFIYHPTRFFLSTLFITWTFWFFAIYVSLQQSMQYLLFPLILLGMSGPTISAFIMLAQSKSKNLWNDFLQRLRFDKIKLIFIPIVFLFMPCLILLATAISLLFGQSSNQFLLSSLSPDQVLEGHNFFAILIILILSCSLEEIGWRGYGIDSLKSKFNLWKTSLIFASIWSLWHVPAFFIKNGYFQQEVCKLGIIYVVNYFIILFPVTILINWVYVKNNRSILIAMLSHVILNLSFSLFQTQPFTRIIIMVLLLVASAIIVVRDKELFFKVK